MLHLSMTVNFVNFIEFGIFVSEVVPNSIG